MYFSPQRNPTPPEVIMREGIPHWPAYTNEKKEFMAIDKYWNVRNDYTLVYTVFFLVKRRKTRTNNTFL